MNRKLLFIILLILPSIWPLFRKDFFPMHDYTHAARLQQLDKALKDGHFPVRWVKDLGWGYGMPLFNFYAPLPYYIGELFHLLDFSFVNCVKIIFGLTFFVSFLGMFFLAKKFWGELGAFLASLAFVYSPYRAVDFYVRGALGELWAIAFLPWAIWGITLIVDKKSKKFISLTAVFLACVFLSHTVLTLISLPFLLIFSIFYLLVNRNKKEKAFWLLSTFILGLGLASFFLIPAYWEKDFTQVSQLTQGFSHYSHHFLYFRQFLYGNWGYGGSVDGIEDLMSFHLGKGHLLLVVITVLFSLFQIIVKKKILKKHWLIAFFVTFSLVLAYLTTYHAKPIWDATSIMAFIQFPWRFNSLIIVFVALLAGGGCLYFEKKFSRKAAFVFFIISMSVLFKTNVRYFRPEKYVSPSDYYYTDEQSIKKSMSGIIPDYIPVWAKKDPEKIASSEYQIVSGNPEIEVLESKTHRVYLKISSDSPSTIQLSRFYFPGWKALVDNKEIALDYEKKDGLINLRLPPGQYTLKVVFKRTPIRLIGELISVLSALLLFLMSFRRRC